MSLLSYTTDWGYERPESAKNLSIPDWDYSVFSSPVTSGTEANRNIVYKNKTSPSDRREQVSFVLRRIDDAYKNTKINPQYQAPDHTGTSLSCQHAIKIMATDSDYSEKVYLPLKITVTITAIDHPAITPDALKQGLCDTVAMLFPTGSVTSGQISDMWAGGLGFIDESSED